MLKKIAPAILIVTVIGLTSFSADQLVKLSWEKKYGWKIQNLTFNTVNVDVQVDYRLDVRERVTKSVKRTITLAPIWGGSVLLHFPEYQKNWIVHRITYKNARIME